MRLVVMIVTAISLLGADKANIAFIDEYLTNWDRFAQGDNSLVPQLKRETARFSEDLSRLLREGDPQAPARAVFYAVVQVGGSIPVQSELGGALKTVLGPDFPTVVSEGKPPVFFAADLYFWWVENSSHYQSFSLFDEWQQREFARKKVIPMYEGLRSQPTKP